MYHRDTCRGVIAPLSRLTDAGDNHKGEDRQGERQNEASSAFQVLLGLLACVPVEKQGFDRRSKDTGRVCRAVLGIHETTGETER